MKTRTLLVDANYMLKRSVHGSKTYTSAGNISGLYSFLTTTRMLVKKHAINKIILCWDGENSGRKRHLLYPDYKSNRNSKEWNSKIHLTESEIRRDNEQKESVLWNRKRIQQYAEDLFIRQVEVDEIEGDDLIASYCIKYNNKEEICIFSNDRDYLQLLDYNIVIIFSNIEEPITAKNSQFHFGFHYQNSLTLKVLCGDTSDNIKGISGLGEKTLLEHFPKIVFEPMSVREICQGAYEINESRKLSKKKPLKAFETLLNSFDQLKLNYRLMNLKEPFLNEEAEEALEQLDVPLSPDGRGSKNLFNLMQEDKFLTVYGGTFVNYIEPFYNVIMHEKATYEQYIKNNKD